MFKRNAIRFNEVANERKRESSSEINFLTRPL